MLPILILATGLLFPEGPALSPDGRFLFCVNVQAAFVSRLDLHAKTLTRDWLTLPDGGRGNGMTLGPDGALYVADVGAKRIVRVHVQTKAVSVVADKDDKGQPLRGPNDLCFDRAGDCYFTDPDGTWDTPVGCVYKVAAGTKLVTKVAGGMRFPNGLALSVDEKTLYVAISPLGDIDAVDLHTGARRVFSHVGEKGGPDGLRVDSAGSVYAAVFGDGVVCKVSPHGKVLARYSAGGQNPTNLCFAPDGKSLYVTESQTNSIVEVHL